MVTSRRSCFYVPTTKATLFLLVALNIPIIWWSGDGTLYPTVPDAGAYFDAPPSSEDRGSFSHWRRRSPTLINQTTYNPSDTTLVLVIHSERSTASYESLQGTVNDVLSSPRALALVYTVSKQNVKRLRFKYSSDIDKGRIAVQLVEPPISDQLGLDVVHDLTYAHLLEFAGQQADRAQYAIIMEAGMRLVPHHGRRTVAASTDFVTRAIVQYKNATRFQSACWMTLSDAPSDGSKDMPTIILESAKHANRMALMLRSALPYRILRTREIVNMYCQWFIWATFEREGPRLFAMEKSTPRKTKGAMTIASPFVNASQIATPEWIDTAVPVGPVVYYDRNETYRIVFGAPTMPRPNNMTEYLEQFMSELIAIVETDFVIHTATTTTFQALILLLVSGNSAESMTSHQLFLQDKYQSAIDRGLVRLVDAPLASYPLDQMRLTSPDEPPERRYWRSKQNLDVASTLEAMSGLSDYVMLLEDDTGFQPGFGQHVKAYISHSSQDQPYGIPQWSVTEYGFGYSGILLHSSDALLYQRLHWALFDERPCDLFNFYLLGRHPHPIHARSPTNFSNGKDLYLKHYGKLSTLAGKSQDVFRR